MSVPLLVREQERSVCRESIDTPAAREARIIAHIARVTAEGAHDPPIRSARKATTIPPPEAPLGKYATPSQVVAQTAADMGIDLAALNARPLQRTQWHARTRGDLAAALHAKGLAYAEIARQFGQDHSTIILAVRNAKKRGFVPGPITR